MFEEIYDLRKKDKINQRGIIMTIDLDKMHKFYEQKKLIQQEIRNKNNSLKIILGSLFPREIGMI